MNKTIGYRLGDGMTPSEVIIPNESNKQSKKRGPRRSTNKSSDLNDFYIVDDIIYFALKGRGKDQELYATVSMNKWPVISQYKWYLGKAGYPICYELGKIQLHRLVFRYVLGQMPPSDLYVDHIDRNKLNNTDANLRLATPQQNSFNKSTETNRKGVRKISDNNYTACITKDGTKHEIKNIATEKQAAEIYNMMAEELFGEFAAPNKV